MSAVHRADVPTSIGRPSPNSAAEDHLIVPAVDVVRDGRAEPFLNTSPTLSSASAHWGGITLENYSVPAILIQRHEHPEHFLHLVLTGNVKYEVTTKGRTLRFTSRPGTAFLLPHGTVDEVNWTGPTQRMAVAIHPHLLTNALEETAYEFDIELSEHWDLIDPHISALLLEMKADLSDGSPAGTMYGESLAIALTVYLLKRYAEHRRTPVVYKCLILSRFGLVRRHYWRGNLPNVATWIFDHPPAITIGQVSWLFERYGAGFQRTLVRGVDVIDIGVKKRTHP